jgi:hypothetical protein
LKVVEVMVSVSCGIRLRGVVQRGRAEHGVVSGG